MSMVDDLRGGGAPSSLDRPWTFNPADPFDISTPVGSVEYFRLRDGALPGPHPSRVSRRKPTILDGLIIAFFALFIVGVFFS